MYSEMICLEPKITKNEVSIFFHTPKTISQGILKKLIHGGRKKQDFI